MKEYINNAYQPYAKHYVSPIQYDAKMGVYYNERPNWQGGETESISQGISNYIFQPLGYR